MNNQLQIWKLIASVVIVVDPENNQFLSPTAVYQFEKKSTIYIFDDGFKKGQSQPRPSKALFPCLLPAEGCLFPLNMIIVSAARCLKIMF